jgi:hypothetical protein
MELCSYIKDGDCTQKGIEGRWHKTFSLVLAYLGPFPRDTRRYMWDELVSGNWERLHITDEERCLPPEYWLEELRSDVFYCSDRWSLDRLTRCHWLYRAYVHACWHEEQER